MKIVWLSNAITDLEALVNFIAQDNPQTAEEIFETLQNAIQRLSIFSNMGRIGRVKNTRELVIPHLPYIIIYLVKKHEIIILAIFHASRKWPNK